MSTHPNYDICSISEIKMLYKATLDYLKKFGYSNTFNTFVEELGIEDEIDINVLNKDTDIDLYLDDFKNKRNIDYYDYQKELILCDYAKLIRKGNKEAVLTFINDYLRDIEGLDEEELFVELTYCLHFDCWDEISEYIEEKIKEDAKYEKIFCYFKPETKLIVLKKYYFIKHNGDI